MSQRGDAYSLDLREKVLNAIETNGWTQEEGAAFFGIGEASIYRWFRLRRETGSAAARLHGGGAPRKVTAVHEAALARFLDEKNDRTLAELRKLLQEETGLVVTDSAVCDAFKRLDLTLKKRRSLRSSATAPTSSGSGRSSSAK
jgi:putative transposase